MNALLSSICQILTSGGVIAYPTEAVFGLGCDPLNNDALKRVLKIKARVASKGFLLVAANWDQVNEFILPITPEVFDRVDASWPGHVTWVFPAKKNISPLLLGEHDSIAIRISTHPFVKQLCQAFGRAIVSTSANLSSHPPVRTYEAAEQQFGSVVDFVVPGETLGFHSPSEIRDAGTGKILRAG